MNELMEEFMQEMAIVFPKLIVQFEDFSTDKVRCRLWPMLHATTS